jgi:hypothetical protein
MNPKGPENHSPRKLDVNRTEIKDLKIPEQRRETGESFLLPLLGK